MFVILIIVYSPNATLRSAFSQTLETLELASKNWLRELASGTCFGNSLRKLALGTRFGNSLRELASGTRFVNLLRELASESCVENSLLKLA
jgi:hypothetical protein